MNFKAINRLTVNLRKYWSHNYMGERVSSPKNENSVSIYKGRYLEECFNQTDLIPH